MRKGCRCSILLRSNTNTSSTLRRPPALGAAAWGAAEAGGVGAREGRLAPGYDGDLRGVDGDLQTDVTALHRARSVLLRGRPVSL